MGLPARGRSIRGRHESCPSSGAAEAPVRTLAELWVLGSGFWVLDDCRQISRGALGAAVARSSDYSDVGLGLLGARSSELGRGLGARARRSGSAEGRDSPGRNATSRGATGGGVVARCLGRNAIHPRDSAQAARCLGRNAIHHRDSAQAARCLGRNAIHHRDSAQAARVVPSRRSRSAEGRDSPRRNATSRGATRGGVIVISPRRCALESDVLAGRVGARTRSALRVLSNQLCDLDLWGSCRRGSRIRIRTRARAGRGVE